MDFVAGEWRRAELRVVRASFSGELAFELHCGAEIATALWQSLIAAGLEPYGLEALDILRLEKGYLTGAEINGQTTPLDLNMQGLMKTPNLCIGRTMLNRPAFQEAQRPVLVGFKAADGRSAVLAGAQITTDGTSNRPVGYVTSSVYSPALAQWIGLALIDRSLSKQDEVLVGRDPLRNGNTPIRITSMTHFDIAGERLRS